MASRALCRRMVVITFITEAEARKLGPTFVPDRRGELILLGDDAGVRETFELAASLGASHVVFLPDGDAWTLELLHADLESNRGRCRFAHGDPDPTPRADDESDTCGITFDGYSCTWLASTPHPAQHVAGTGSHIARVWDV